MKKNEAAQLVSHTFTHAFSEEQFVGFVRNLLPGMKASSTRTVPNAQLPQGFREHIQNYTRLGTYRDPQGDVLDVVVVKLKRRGSLDRARTRQRNLMAHYLNKRSKDAVLVAYITDDPEDWRFSYVKLAYQTEISGKGKVKVKREFTPARRYSFLVGEHEPNHTAQKQLGDLLMRGGKLTLEQIEEAFNIESVTKEFFEDYKGLFLQIKENMDQIVASNQKVKTEFERCQIDTANFAKKLLGQIVFLYFLQKKGWLGVAQDAAWGTGDKKFMHNLYLNKGERNYFDDILEPFFYEALAIERKGDFYPALQCKVPFLNGGLFEPLNGYDWDKILIDLDDEVFAEVFNVFNLYNFTVREDEPLEREVAVDPEMLGKVFENLLEVKDRRSKGTYYTPREIVHYMCQESLINYLDTALNTETQKVAKEDIESFIQEGDTSLENDLAKEAGRKSGDYGLPESIREFAKEIDFALAGVKICDPAIGSGAFPVGMMTEIVRARDVLTTHLQNKRNRDAYTFKWHCIENSLYGVDIDASAVEIAKLRLWLSLVVDEESYDRIRPLPNLDYRIVCGNSLLSVQKNLFNYTLYPELEKKKDQYFGATSPKNKNALRNEIENLIDQLTDGKRLFDFEVYFSEVFSSKQGFDIVIGNPPYIGEKGNKKLFTEVRQGKLGKFYLRKMDIFYFFIHLALEIGKINSKASFITTNYYLTADGARNLRKDLKTRSEILKLIDFNELHIFESARGQHNIITIFSKANSPLTTTEVITHVNTCRTRRQGNANEKTFSQILDWDDDVTNYYSFPCNELFDGPEFYIRLEGIGGKTETPTQSLLNRLRSQGEVLGNLCKVSQGLLTGVDRITNRHINAGIIDAKYKNNGVYILSKEEFDSLDWTNEQKSLLRRFYKNSDIKKYHSSKSPNYYVLYLTRDLDIDDFPDIKRHVQKFKKPIQARSQDRGEIQAALRLGKWWVIFAAREKEVFTGPKIITPQRSYLNTFAYNEEDWFGSADVYFITSKINRVDLKYVLSLLNSKLYYLWLYFRGKKKGEMLELFYTPLTEIPIKVPSKEKQQPFIEIANKILALTQSSNYLQDQSKQKKVLGLEARIDRLVYQLYELTEEEIAIVEESVGR